jgi:hypothetical protein
MKSPDNKCRLVVVILTGCFILFTSGYTRADLFSFNDKGLHIDGGSMGAFDLEYPVLGKTYGESAYKVIAKETSGSSATVQYEGGAVLTAQVDPDGNVTYSVAHLPEDVKELRYTMLINFSYQQGGKWKFGAGTNNPFPIAKPSKAHLFQDHATKFQLTNHEGKSLSFGFPDSSYLELQDNRAWNWPVYALVAHLPLTKDNPTYKITVNFGSSSPDEKPVALIDALGQIKALDWPNKVKSVEELQTDVKSEQDYYAGLHPPTWDKFGGLPDSGNKFDLKATGFFHVEKKGDKWMLVDPDGNLFFHLGVCGMAPSDDYTTVSGRELTYEWLPPRDGEFKTAYRPENDGKVFSYHLANMIRKYGKPYEIDDFSSIMIDRISKWGFNSIGAFSSTPAAVVQAKNFPYVSGLPINAWKSKIKFIPGIAQTWDPFDTDNVDRLEQSFATTLPDRANDPLLIGYFLTNEPLYEDIPKVIPGLKGSTYACKRELVQMLSDEYKTIDAFNKAWAASAASFDELEDAPLAVNTKEASEDMDTYTGKFFDSYFKLVSDTFHKYDTHHMLIGNRFQPGTINNEQLCRAAGKYLDIMSFNYYTDGVDKDFLNRIYQWTGRPMLLSEFYWSASGESGLAGGREVATQQERGLAYRNYVEQSASLGYVVGIEWFTLVDQATTGRWFSGMDGERANTGLISVADRPWKAMLAEMMKTNYSIYQVELGEQSPFVFDNPRFAQAGYTKNVAFIPHATGAITLDCTTANWPGIPPEIISGKHLVEGADSGGVEGTFKLCWDEKYLYVLASIVDPTPLQNKQTIPSKLWNGDAIEIFLGSEKLDQGGALLFSDRHLIIGAGNRGKVPFYDDKSPQPYACETFLVPGSDGKSYTLEAGIPWEALDVTPKVGTTLLFDIAIDDSSNGQMRNRQITWNGTDKNSGDRTHWGTAKLMP